MYYSLREVYVLYPALFNFCSSVVSYALLYFLSRQ